MPPPFFAEQLVKVQEPSIVTEMLHPSKHNPPPFPLLHTHDSKVRVFSNRFCVIDELRYNTPPFPDVRVMFWKVQLERLNEEEQLFDVTTLMIEFDELVRFVMVVLSNEIVADEYPHTTPAPHEISDEDP